MKATAHLSRAGFFLWDLHTLCSFDHIDPASVFHGAMRLGGALPAPVRACIQPSPPSAGWQRLWDLRLTVTQRLMYVDLCEIFHTRQHALTLSEHQFHSPSHNILERFFFAGGRPAHRLWRAAGSGSPAFLHPPLTGPGTGVVCLIAGEKETRFICMCVSYNLCFVAFYYLLPLVFFYIILLF